METLDRGRQGHCSNCGLRRQDRDTRDWDNRDWDIRDQDTRDRDQTPRKSRYWDTRD